VVLLLLVLSAAFSAQVADTASGYDLVGLLGAVAADAARLRWQFAILVVRGVPYIAAGATRASRLGFRPMVYRISSTMGGRRSMVA
jgi:hypothetical protein